VLDVSAWRYERVESIEYKNVLLQDAGPISLNDFKACIDFIQTHVDRGDKILVHCSAGRNRSTAIVVGYLLVSGAYKNWADAFKYVKSKRKGIGCRHQLIESVLAAVGWHLGDPQDFSDLLTPGRKP
jgi:protein-tyrosine phosphatase